MPAKSYNIVVIAGEASGDIIGSQLIRAFKSLKVKAKFSGMGGNEMQAEGFNSVCNMHKISVMGVLEVIPKLYLIKNFFDQLIAYIIKNPPDIIVTIDFPDFNIRLAKKLREKYNMAIPIIHYVAPTIWAYNSNRIYHIAKYFNHQLLILPFEKPLFDAIDFSSTFVGHPTTENNITRKRNKKNIITVMPGSRENEIKQHLPIFLYAIKKLIKLYPDITIFIPTLPHLERMVKEYTKSLDNLIVSALLQDKDNILPYSKVALVKSGTSSVELMNHKIPMIVAYKINFLSAFYIKYKIKCKYASICNIVMDQEIIPELLLGKCNKENVFNHLHKLYNSKSLQDIQKRGLAKAIKKLSNPDNLKPSVIAAKVILSTINTT